MGRIGELHPTFVIALFFGICFALVAFVKFSIVDEAALQLAKRPLRNRIDRGLKETQPKRKPPRVQRQRPRVQRQTVRSQAKVKPERARVELSVREKLKPLSLFEVLTAHAEGNPPRIGASQVSSGLTLVYQPSPVQTPAFGIALGQPSPFNTQNQKQKEFPAEYREGYKEITTNPKPDFTTAASQVRQSIVRIWSADSPQRICFGTGFAVGDGHIVVTSRHLFSCSYEMPTRHDGHIVVTSRHLVGTGKEILVQTEDDRIHEASLLTDLPHRDLAALSVQTHIEPLRLATAEQFTWETPVFVIGHTRSAKSLQNTGKLDYLEPWEEFGFIDNPQLMANDTLIIHTDVRIQEGQSGSPLMTADGLLVGVMSWVRGGATRGNFCIHQQHVRELFELAITKTGQEVGNSEGRLAVELTPQPMSEVEGDRVRAMNRYLKKMNRTEKRKAKSEKRKYALRLQREKWQNKYGGRRSRRYRRGGGTHPIVQEGIHSLMHSYFYGPH